MHSGRHGPRWPRELLVAALIALPLPAQQQTRSQAGEGQFTHQVLAPGIAASAPLAIALRTAIGGERTERVPGDFWTVASGATISFENPHEHAAAIIRVTYFELHR